MADAGSSQTVYMLLLAFIAVGCSDNGTDRDRDPFAPTGMDGAECAAANRTMAYPDMDGDGWTLPEGECFVEVPPGYGPRSYNVDCDDADPDRKQIIHADADFDGEGAPEPGGCREDFPSDMPLPPGFSRTSRDCDYTNPAIRAGALEEWGDRIDSDCDGYDEPLPCVEGTSLCGCDLLGLSAVAVDESCAAADLFIAGVTQCCGILYVVVGNRGTLPADGFEISERSPQPAPQQVNPGEFTRPIEVYERDVGANIVVRTSTPECSIDDNTLPFEPEQCSIP